MQFNKSNLHKNHLSSKYLEMIFQNSLYIFLTLIKGHFSIISDNKRQPKLCSNFSFVFIKLREKYNNLEYKSSESLFDNKLLLLFITSDEALFILLLSKKEIMHSEKIFDKNGKFTLFSSHIHWCIIVKKILKYFCVKFGQEEKIIGKILNGFL